MEILYEIMQGIMFVAAVMLFVAWLVWGNL